MKKILIALSLIMTTTFVFGQLTTEQEKLYKEVVEASQKRFIAIIKGNHKELNRFFHDSIIMILSHRKQKYTLKQYQDSMAYKILEYDTVHNLSDNPQFYNNNKICILTGERRIKYKRHPKLSLKFTFSEVFYLDENNQWKLIYLYASKPTK